MPLRVNLPCLYVSLSHASACHSPCLHVSLSHASTCHSASTCQSLMHPRITLPPRVSLSYRSRRRVALAARAWLRAAYSRKCAYSSTVLIWCFIRGAYCSTVLIWCCEYVQSDAKNNDDLVLYMQRINSMQCFICKESYHVVFGM